MEEIFLIGVSTEISMESLSSSDGWTGLNR